MRRLCFLIALALGAHAAHAAGIIDAVEEQMAKEELAACGVRPPEASWFDKTTKNEKFDAAERFNLCYARLAERRKRETEAMVREYESRVFQIHEACRSAIKKRISSSDTVSFAPYRYSMGDGYNAAGVDITAGGFSVDVSGSYAEGNFNVRCYMNKNFVVTQVR
jgi:hypothetical protein